MLMGTVSAWAADSWVKTAPANLQTGDIVVIVDQTTATAMSNNGGTSSAPAATAVTLSTDKSEISGEVAATLQWVVTKSDGSYKFNVADTENYLYCTNTNNGVRVGTNSNNAFTIYDNNGVDFLLNTATSRYIGVYNSQDWRCYTSINANIKECVTAFYKKVSSDTPQKTKIASIESITPTSINIDGEGTFEATITPATGVTASAYTVTWSADNDDLLVVDTNGDYLAGSNIGSVNVTVTVTPTDVETYEEVSKSFSVTIVDPNANDGSAEHPYTVAEARAAIDAGTGVTGVYAKGIVSEIVTAYSSQFGNITYNISADGTTTADQLQAYRGFSYNGDWFTSEDDIQVGDEVVIYGNLKKYNSTYEFDASNQLVSLTRGSKETPTFDVDKAEVELNVGETADVTLTTNTDGAISAESDAPSVATVALKSGTTYTITAVAEGEATITISAPATDGFLAASKTITVTVVDPNAATKGTKDNPYTVAEVIDGTATGNEIYVEGYIVGSWKNNKFDPQDLVNTNLALADNADETDEDNTIPVELKSAFRPDFGLTDGGKAYNIGIAKVLIKGNAKKYFSVNGIKELSSIEKVAERIKITDAGMATYYTDVALDFTGLTDMEAYVANEVDGGTVKFTQVDIVPANVAVVLRNPNGGSAEHVVPVTDAEPTATVTSELIGTLTGIDELATNADGKTNYILNVDVNGENVGFYQANGEAVAPHRAYLQLGGSARTFIGFDETTAITNVNREAITNNRYYTLDGRRVENPTKGIYIINGKKVVIR